MNNLYQLVYTSQRAANCDQQEIEKILDSCRRNNPNQNITGVLLHSDDRFIQYLEGDKDIIKLYDAIKEDKRHKAVVLLSYGPLKERVFPGWHMGYKNLTKSQIDFLTEGNLADQQSFQSIIKGEQQTSVSAISLLTKFFKAA